MHTHPLPSVPALIPCPACRRGCGCQPGDPGCGHYGCWGQAPTSDCPGAGYEMARYDADRRRSEQAERARRARRARVRSGLLLTVPASFRLA